ncbi:MAG: B12-binding domain-containing radical SAM protein, partial [Chloroflexota bacterium]
MRVLLVQPKWSLSLVGFNRLARPEPLALEVLKASLPNHEVVILDLRVDERPNALTETMASFKPQVVGVTGYTTDVPNARQVLAEIKACDPTIITVMGGHHASLCPEDFDSPNVDYIVIGEGEVTLPDLLDTLESKRDPRAVEGVIYRENEGQVFSGPRAAIRDLDSSPVPDREATAQYRDQYFFRFWQGAYTM